MNFRVEMPYKVGFIKVSLHSEASYGGSRYSCEGNKKTPLSSRSIGEINKNIIKIFLHYVKGDSAEEK